MKTIAKDQKYVSLAVIGLLMFGFLGGGPGLDMVLPCEAISNDAYIPCKGLVELEIAPIQPATVSVPKILLNNTTRNYTTHLITTRWSAGPFFMAHGRAITAPEAREVHNEQRSGDCRLACIFADWCVAFSTVNTTFSVLCHLADHLPITTEVNDRAAYHVFYERLPGAIQVFTIKGTNDIYLVPMTELTYPKAEASCNGIPGFRPAVFITRRDIQILLSLYSELGVPLFVGLKKTIAGVEWVDGTSYSISYYFFHNPNGIAAYNFGKNYFRFKSDESGLRFLDIDDHSYRFLCQAYLF